MSKGIKTFTEETIADKTLEGLNDMHLDINVSNEGAELIRVFPMPPIKTNER